LFKAVCHPLRISYQEAADMIANGGYPGISRSTTRRLMLCDSNELFLAMNRQTMVSFLTGFIKSLGLSPNSERKAAQALVRKISENDMGVETLFKLGDLTSTIHQMEIGNSPEEE
jgi:hypothetical protein